MSERIQFEHVLTPADCCVTVSDGVMVLHAAFRGLDIPLLCSSTGTPPHVWTACSANTVLRHTVGPLFERLCFQATNGHDQAVWLHRTSVLRKRVTQKKRKN
jgi:hypothetical protein